MVHLSLLFLHLSFLRRLHLCISNEPLWFSSATFQDDIFIMFRLCFNKQISLRTPILGQLCNNILRADLLLDPLMTVIHLCLNLDRKWAFVFDLFSSSLLRFLSQIQAILKSPPLCALKDLPFHSPYKTFFVPPLCNAMPGITTPIYFHLLFEIFISKSSVSIYLYDLYHTQLLSSVPPLCCQILEVSSILHRIQCNLGASKW